MYSETSLFSLHLALSSSTSEYRLSVSRAVAKPRGSHWGFSCGVWGTNVFPEFRVDLSLCVQSVRNVAKCPFLKLKGANEEGNGREVTWNPPSVKPLKAASLSVQ